MRSRWLLPDVWLLACERHYEALARKAEDGPVRKLAPQCARYLGRRRYLAALLLRAFRIAPAPGIVRLDGDRIAVTAIDAEASDPSVDGAAERARTAEAARGHLRRLIRIENEPASRLAMDVWQWMSRRGRIFSLPRMAHRARAGKGPAPRPGCSGDSHGAAAKLSIPTRARIWNVFGPAWFEELTQGEPGARTGNSRTRSNALVAVDASTRDDDVVDLLNSMPASQSGGGTVVWFLDDEHRPEIVRRLNAGHVAVASGRQNYDILQAEAECRVCRAAPAVQPALHNPIGWWNGNEGVTGRHEHGAQVPEAWRARFDAARGLQSEPRAPVPVVLTEAGLVEHRERFLRARKAWLNDSISRRLDTLAGFAFGRASRDAGPLVSVVVATSRPERVAPVMDAVKRQSHPRLELVLVLHRGRFDKRELSAMVEKFGRRVLLLRGSDDWTPGELAQHGCSHATGSYIAKLSDDDHYGDNFIRDRMLCLQFSQAQVAVTARSFLRRGNHYPLLLRNSQHEYEYAYPAVGGGALLFRRDVIEHVEWRAVPSSEDAAFIDDCRCQLIPVVTADMFNYASTATEGEDVSRDYLPCSGEISIDEITC